MKKIILLIATALILLNLQAFSQTWTVLSSGTTQNLARIYVTTINEVYATGNNGIVLKSVNQGSTWTSQTVGIPNFRGMFFTSPTNGYISGGILTPSDLSYIYKTTNSGTSWTLQQNSNPAALRGLYFPNQTTGYCVGGNSASVTYIYKSTDSGTTWTSQTPGTTNTLNAVCFTDVNTGYAVGLNGGIVKTTNGGTTWNTQTSGTSNHLISVCFLDANTGYAVGYNGTILKTTNGGTTWTLIPIPGFTANLNAVYFFNVNHGFIVGGGGAIIETYDGGTTWSQYLAISTEFLTSIHFLNQNLGYACGDNGTILKFTSTIGVNEIENIPVCNAFPNPANDQLTVNLSGNNLKNVKIAFCNELGQNIFEVQENTPSDHYTKTIDTRALATGIYFISVTTEKSKWTKKISINH